MMTLATAQKDIQLDDYGLLLNPDDWNESVALILAHQAGISQLTADHWKVIHTFRTHFEKFGTAPTIYNVCRSYGHQPDWVHNLFNGCLNAWIVSGLPDPGEEAKTYLNDM